MNTNIELFLRVGVLLFLNEFLVVFTQASRSSFRRSGSDVPPLSSCLTWHHPQPGQAPEEALHRLQAGDGHNSTQCQVLRELSRVRLEITHNRWCKGSKGYRCRQRKVALLKKLRHLRHNRPSHSDTHKANPLTPTVSRRKRAATSDLTKRWPNAVVPYAIHPDQYRPQNIEIMTWAMRDWEKDTCLVFKEREPDDPHYIFIEKTKCGCCAAVGLQSHGPQLLSLGNRCVVKSIVLHELGHALGLFHEHNRPDRDQYVTIHTENIQPGMEFAFHRKPANITDLLDEPYDHESIMHYPRNRYAKIPILDTISSIRAPGEFAPKPLGGFGLTEGDVRRINKMYNCPTCGHTLQTLTGQMDHTANRSHPVLTCQWRISVTPGSVIQLSVDSFNLPAPNKDCEAYLEARDGPTVTDTLLGRFCGPDIPHGALISTGPRMWLQFKTTREGQAFAAQYQSSCHFKESKERGELSSPNFPFEYPPSADCEWLLTAKEGATIHVTFSTFRLRAYGSRDFVEVRDGSNASSPLIGKYIHNKPPDIQSTGSSLFIRFVSDRRYQAKGFRLSYIQEVDECLQQPSPCDQGCLNTIGSYTCDCYLEYELHTNGRTCIPKCGGNYSSGSGSIVSSSFPDLYPPNKECTWLFHVPPRHWLYLDFAHFDLEGDFLQCRGDNLSVEAGPVPGLTESLGEFCGFLPPPHFKLDERFVKLKFTSDDTVQKTGFNITYHFDRDECATNQGGCEHRCENTIGSFKCSCYSGFLLAEDGLACTPVDLCANTIEQPTGVFHSRNFPFRYPRKHDCSWRLATSVGHRVRIRFRTFWVEKDRRCRYDRLTIYDGPDNSSPELSTLCGFRKPAPITSSSNQMFLSFFTDASKEFMGFYVKHDTVCGSGTIPVLSASQTLLSHGLHGKAQYPNRQRCHWTMTADQGYVIEVIFDSFQLEYEDTCSFDVVKVFDGPTDKAPLLGTYCGERAPFSLTSSGPGLMIQFQSDDTITDQGFSMVFHQLLPGSDNK